MNPTMQVTKLDTDPASAAAKPGSAAPAKVAAPPPSTHDPKTGPWVRFWQDKPQHWGVPPAVKSSVDLAAANIQRNNTSPPSKPSTELATAHHAAVTSSHTTDILPEHRAEPCAMQALDQAAGIAAHVGGIGSAAESSAAAGSPVQASARSSSHHQASAEQTFESVTAADESTLAGNKCHLSFTAAASTNTADSGAPKSTSVPVTAGAGADADASAASAKPAGKQAAYNMYSPSKATLQILKRPPSKEPSPRKQVPLHQLLARQAAQGPPHAQGRITSSQDPQQQQPRPQHPQQTDTAAEPTASAAAAEQPVSRVVLPHAVQLPAHSHQQAKLQGLALSQIDASVFAALPAEHQQELLHNLPKSTNRPSGAAPVERNQMGASDFAFVTKLANLQKGGQSHSSPALDTSSAKVTDSRHQAPPEITMAAAEGTDAPLDGSGGTAANSVSEARCLGSAKTDGAASSPSVAVLSASDQEAARAEEDAQTTSPGDPAFISQLSADSGAGRAASHASPDKGTIMLNDQPTALLDHSDTSMPAVSAQQAQQPAPSIKSATDAAGHDKDNEMDQALDMDLVEEEWVALAAQGQRAGANNRDHTLAGATTADSAPLCHAHHSLDHHGSEAAHNGAPPKHSGQLNASSAPGPAQQQMQEWRAAGMQQQPVSALPPASQIDSSVLDALPLQVRRELELAYGTTTKSCSSAPAAAQQAQQLCVGLI